MKQEREREGEDLGREVAIESGVGYWARFI
jgi:hypothetical protein